PARRERRAQHGGPDLRRAEPDRQDRGLLRVGPEVIGLSQRAARLSRNASARTCSISSGGSCTSKSTPSIAIRIASHERSSSPVRYSHVCASIGLIVPQWAGT